MCNTCASFTPPPSSRLSPQSQTTPTTRRNRPPEHTLVTRHPPQGLSTAPRSPDATWPRPCVRKMANSNQTLISESTFTYLALVVSSLTIGYWIGLGKSLGYTRAGNSRRDWSSSDEDEKPLRRSPNRPGSQDSGSSADEVDSHDENDLKSVKPSWTEDSKLVLVVRSDLGMTKGKIAAQCSHATLACYKTLKRSNPTLLRHWERSGQAKIALKLETNEADSQEDEMLLLKAKARSLGLCAQDIQDAGRTQIAAGSRTVLGIGPGPVSLINQVTRHLKLL